MPNTADKNKKQLPTTEELYRALFNQAADAIILMDTETGELVDFNERAHENLGYTRDEFRGITIGDIEAGESPEQVREHIAEVLRSGSDVFETKHRTKDGEVRDILVSASAVALKGKSYIQGIWRDITDRNRLADRLTKSNECLSTTLEELKRAQRHIIEHERLAALGQMARGIAHDFNNLLMPIVGCADYLLADPSALNEEDTVKEMLRTIREAACEAGDKVRQLRNFCRPRPDAVHTTVSIEEVVKEAVALTRPRWKEETEASGTPVEVKLNLGDVPAVVGNLQQLQEAVVVLILNAVDAMPEGGVITISSSEDRHIGTVALEVADTGTGMSEDVRHRCREPFFTTKGPESGGMGLAMAHGIVGQHKGSLEVESSPGKGTKVEIVLPAAYVSAPPPEPEPGPEPEAAKAQNQPEILPMRILVVDDEAGTRNVLGRFLSRDGHTVELASGGAEAIEKFREQGFDLVITDRAMPNMSGAQLAREVKELDPDVRVILLTGFADLHEGENGEEDEPSYDLHLGKPASLEEIRAAVAGAMAR